MPVLLIVAATLLFGFVVWRLVATILTPKEKVCPRCAERIKAAALVCRYCGYEFPKSDV